MSHNNTCRAKGCTAKCGSFRYCAAHRKANRAKARAQRASRSCRANRFSLLPVPSAPTASEAFYTDQADRKLVEAVGPVITIAPAEQNGIIVTLGEAAS